MLILGNELESKQKGCEMSTKGTAAKKAWKTRKENEKKIIRHEAAKKAWATRSKNEVSERQSKAAKKAWKTRRTTV